jgi:DNA-binding transcriptional MerR regulator
MPDKAIYTAADLESFTGVPHRTLRYYVTQGLIPSAYRRGASPVCWGQEHLNALREVLKAKDTNVTIQDLRVRFGYKDPLDNFEEDDIFDEYTHEDVLTEGDVVSLDEIAEQEFDTDDDEDYGEWSDQKVHRGWYRRW